jgi:hypothetical protein
MKAATTRRSPCRRLPLGATERVASDSATACIATSVPTGPPFNLAIDDVGGVLQRADESSILVIYQHRPKLRKSGSYYAEIAGYLSQELGFRLLYAADGVVGFFVICKTRPRTEAVTSVLAEFCSVRGKLFGSPSEHSGWEERNNPG